MADAPELVERLLAGPIDTELTARELALLHAYLHNNRVRMSWYQQANRGINCPELERHKKLLTIWDFNRSLPRTVAETGSPGKRWVWDLCPLTKESWGNREWADDGTPAGQVISIRHTQTRAVVTNFDGDKTPITRTISRRFYVPKPNDFDLLATLFPQDDPRQPAWHVIKADLMLAGHESENLDKMEAPSLLALLRKAHFDATTIASPAACEAVPPNNGEQRGDPATADETGGCSAGATLRDCLSALSGHAACTEQATKLFAKGKAAGPATKGSAAEYFTIGANRERSFANKYLDEAMAMPGFAELKTLLLASSLPVTFDGGETLAARAAMPAGKTVDDVLDMPLCEAVELVRKHVTGAPPDDDAGKERQSKVTGRKLTQSKGNGKGKKRRDGLAQLERDTPALTTGGGNWVRSGKTAKLEGLEPATLRKYRYEGETNKTKDFGRDRDGRIWRRTGTPKAHPFYLRSSLVSERGKPKA